MLLNQTLDLLARCNTCTLNIVAIYASVELVLMLDKGRTNIYIVWYVLWRNGCSLFCLVLLNVEQWGT